jgi:chemotaxis protein CheD
MTSLDRLLRESVVVGHHVEPSPDDGVRRVFLHAGHLWVAREATEITTILGSCVAICMSDPVAGVGGMNHYMLPHDIGSHSASPRYARHATEMLLVRLHELGADPTRLQARIYGGACMLGLTAHAGNDLGTQNVRVAREYLHFYKVAIVAENTGGAEGRRVVYDTATGRAVVTKVHRVIP